MYRERQLASGETEIREPADQASIRPVLRPVSSAPDVEAKSTPERQRRLEPREMPVERGALPLQSWQAAAPHIRTVLLGLGLLAALGAGAWYGDYCWWTTGRFIVSTDDAYVGAHAAILEAKVSGYMSAIEFDDNARVRAGDVIARIDGIREPSLRILCCRRRVRRNPAAGEGFRAVLRQCPLVH